MEVLSLIIKIILCIFSLFLIVVVLLQSDENGRSSAIANSASSVIGKKKARGLDAMLVKLTKVAAIGFFILAVALVLIQSFAK